MPDGHDAPARIVLINMPFAAADRPSLGLTQLSAALRDRLDDAVEVAVEYPNLDVAERFGLAQYATIAHGPLYAVEFGNWLFSRLAFDSASCFEAYFGSVFDSNSEAARVARRCAAEAEVWLDAWLDELVARYALRDALLVGMTSMFQQHVPSIALARRLAQSSDSPPVVLGGASCEFPMAPALARMFPHIDAVFSGPATESLPALVERLLDPPETPTALAGVYRSHTSHRLDHVLSAEGPLRPHGAERSIDDPLDLDYDAWLDDIDSRFGDAAPTVCLPFETARGCWWGERSHCTFCGISDDTLRYRRMAPALALEQFDKLFRYAQRALVYEAVDDIMATDYFDEVLPRLTPPTDVSIFYEVKANLDDDAVRKLSRAQVRVVQPGIEALNTGTLKLMRKGTDALRNLALLKACVRWDVFPTWNLLVGVPGEPEATYAKYLDDFGLMPHLCPPSGVFTVRYDRFSPYVEAPARFSLQLAPLDFYRHIYPYDDDDLGGIAYHFTDTGASPERAVRLQWWRARLEIAVERWKTLWFDSARNRNGVTSSEFPGDLAFRDPYNERRPRLEYVQCAPDHVRVIDSRADPDQPTTLEFAGTVALVVQSLDSAADAKALSRRLGSEVPTVAAALEELQAARVVFREGDRFLSLIVQPASWFAKGDDGLPLAGKLGVLQSLHDARAFVSDYSSSYLPRRFVHHVRLAERTDGRRRQLRRRPHGRWLPSSGCRRAREHAVRAATAGSLQVRP